MDFLGKTHDLSTPDKIARVAEGIYEEKFKKNWRNNVTVSLSSLMS